MTTLYKITPNSVLNWLTAFCLFEIPMAYLFKSISKKNDYVVKWYSGKHINIWNVIAQDMLYAFCGIILAVYLFNYLTAKKIISKNFFLFLIVLIGVQWLGDLTFASTIMAWPNSHSTKWITFFKNYIKSSGFNAIIGDTLWITAWAISYFFVVNYIKRFDIKIFIICLFFFLLSAYSVL
jgi:hypothetical protein|tara:strand:- start:774 stop:1313 length:540 start_codon:yes stop_codon:yes gene_type:complete